LRAGADCIACIMGLSAGRENKNKTWFAYCNLVLVWNKVSEKEVNHQCRKGGDGMRVMFEKKQRAPVNRVENYITASINYQLYQDATT